MNITKGAVAASVESSPVGQAAIGTMRLEIEEAVNKGHRHSRLVKRGWLDRLLSGERHRTEWKKCEGRLIAAGPQKLQTEFDPEFYSLRIVISQQFDCLSPCFPDDDHGGRVIYYAATTIPCIGLERAMPLTGSDHVPRETSP